MFFAFFAEFFAPFAVKALLSRISESCANRAKETFRSGTFNHRSIYFECTR